MRNFDSEGDWTPGWGMTERMRFRVKPGMTECGVRNDGFWEVAGLALGAPPQAFRSERSERRNEAIAEGRT